MKNWLHTKKKQKKKFYFIIITILFFYFFLLESFFNNVLVEIKIFNKIIMGFQNNDVKINKNESVSRNWKQYEIKQRNIHHSSIGKEKIIANKKHY